MSPTFDQTLMDASQRFNSITWHLDNTSVPAYDGVTWEINYFPLRGGKQDGVQLLEIDTGAMVLTVVPTRGMNVLSARTENTRFGWDSPVKEVVHPAYINENSRGGLGWLEGFNELVARCGLENTGAAGPDTIVDNQGNQSTVNLPLHGRLSNIPATRVWVRIETEPLHRLVVGGTINDQRMFGPSYQLTTEISAEPGGTSFTIEDEIKNVSANPAECEVLYHCNYGPPLLGRGARIVAPVEKMSARDEIALEGLSDWDCFDAPQPGFVEQCYFFTLHSDARNMTSVALVGPRGDRAARLSFSTDQLPAFTLWKNTASNADGYVTGLEPATDYPNPRQFERQQGRVTSLSPHEVYNITLEMELVDNSYRVDEVAEEIRELSRGKQTHISTTIDSELSGAES